jgi:hypothetical protein
MNERELKTIQRLVKKAKGAKRYRLSPELKQRIARLYRESGERPTPFARKIGISDPTMLAIAKDAPGGFRKVSVTPESQPLQCDALKNLTLQLPGGALVSGLSLSDIRQLIGGPQ